VTNAVQWREQRRPELAGLFERYEYGVLPAPMPVTATVEREDAEAFGGTAVLREVTLALTRPEGAKIHLLLVVPKDRKQPAPVFVGLNFRGNHALLDDPKVRVRPGFDPGKARTVEETRGLDKDVWALDQSLHRGYAVATFWNGDVVPDGAVAATNVLSALGSGKRELQPTDPGALAAWAWCLHRAVDYLVTLPELDPHRIAVVGHSRNGKAAILAGALDERFAIVVPSQAGSGGTSPCRTSPDMAKLQANGRPTAETLDRIVGRFPHWFCPNFAAFTNAPARLPFDQHALIALCAPRPVLLSCATEDQWSDPAGQFAMLQAADPVYRLVAGDGLLATHVPSTNELSPGRLGYYIRPGKHSMTREDWAVWLDYADRWMGRPSLLER
jgi:hypothetical protein